MIIESTIPKPAPSAAHDTSRKRSDAAPEGAFETWIETATQVPEKAPAAPENVSNVNNPEPGSDAAPGDEENDDTKSEETGDAPLLAVLPWLQQPPAQPIVEPLAADPSGGGQVIAANNEAGVATTAFLPTEPAPIGIAPHPAPGTGTAALAEQHPVEPEEQPTSAPTPTIDGLAIETPHAAQTTENPDGPLRPGKPAIKENANQQKNTTSAPEASEGGKIKSPEGANVQQNETAVPAPATPATSPTQGPSPAPAIRTPMQQNAPAEPRARNAGPAKGGEKVVSVAEPANGPQLFINDPSASTETSFTNDGSTGSPSDFTKTPQSQIAPAAPFASEAPVPATTTNNAAQGVQQPAGSQSQPAAAPTAPAQAAPRVIVPFHAAREADSVIKQISIHLRPDVTEMKLRLDPAGLGELRIRFIYENGELSARVQATEESTANLLRDHGENLRQSMREAGINITNLDVGTGGARREKNTSDHTGTTEWNRREAEERRAAERSSLKPAAAPRVRRADGHSLNVIV